MTASEKIEIQQEIRKLVAQRDSLNDRLRSYRPKYSKGPQQKQWRNDQQLTDTNDELKETQNEPQLKTSNKRTFDNSGNSNFFGPDFEVEKRPKITQDNKTQDRNRRMMSVGILSHLFSARDQLQKEENSKKTQLQRYQVQKVEEKLEFGKRNLLELKKRDFEEKRAEDLLQADLIQSKLIEKENELTRINLVNHYHNMKNFIGTKCQPMIFWYPSKMNNLTESLKQETINSIEGKIKSFEAKDFSGVIISRYVSNRNKSDNNIALSSSEYITPTEPSSEFVTPIEAVLPIETSTETIDFNEIPSELSQVISNLQQDCKESSVDGIHDLSVNKINNQPDSLFPNPPSLEINESTVRGIGT